MKMPFGKFRGVPIEDLDDDYLRWLDQLDDLREPLRSAVTEECVRRNCTKKVHMNLSMVQESIEAGRRTLAKKFHPDSGGSTEKMQMLNSTCDFLKSRMALVF